MISFGTNIQSNADMLQKVPVKYLYDSLRHPRPDIVSSIRQLRIVRELDNKQYSLLKRKLPYLVCGMFNPPYRRTENFAYTEYFIIDIDHLSEKGLSLADTRKRIEKDTRTVLSFVSPGEDGLKVLFKLKERCYDSGLYSLFYKSFLAIFSEQYALQQVVDIRTSDVTRALFEQKRKQEQQEKEQETLSKAENRPSDPDSTAMERIKQLLNPKPHKEKPPVYVPKELNDIIADLKSYIEQTGVIVPEIINIQYGKKIRFEMGLKKAEVNLFFGKKGFSVVQSPRSGTNAELNRLMAELVTTFIDGL